MFSRNKLERFLKANPSMLGAKQYCVTYSSLAHKFETGLKLSPRENTLAYYSEEKKYYSIMDRMWTIIV
jgi:hypothetical protein